MGKPFRCTDERHHVYTNQRRIGTVWKTSPYGIEWAAADDLDGVLGADYASAQDANRALLRHDGARQA